MNNALYAEWLEARTRFTQLLDKLQPEDLTKKNGNSPNSVGFLVRHILEVELLFAKNVFKHPEAKIVAKTVIDKRDTGEWVDLAALHTLNTYAFDMLGQAILNHAETDWFETITTPEFGTKTKIQAFGRIVSHTAYHAGQLALAIKYGN